MAVKQKFAIMLFTFIYIKSLNTNIIEECIENLNTLINDIDYVNISSDLYIKFVLHDGFYSNAVECKNLYKLLLSFKNEENREQLFKLVINLQQKMFTLNFIKDHFDTIYEKITEKTKNLINGFKWRLVKYNYNKQIKFYSKLKSKFIKQMQEIKDEINGKNRINEKFGYVSKFYKLNIISNSNKSKSFINCGISLKSIHDRYKIFLQNIMKYSGITHKDITIIPFNLNKYRILIERLISFTSITLKQTDKLILKSLKVLNCLINIINHYNLKKVQVDEIYKFNKKHSTTIHACINDAFKDKLNIYKICQLISILFIEEKDHDSIIYDWFCQNGLEN